MKVNASMCVEGNILCFALNELEGTFFYMTFYFVEEIENIFKLSLLFLFTKNCFIVLELILCDLIYYQ